MSRIDWFQPWKGSQKLEQGLIVPRIAIPKLTDIPKPNRRTKKKIGYYQFDAVILSQSCDLNGKAVEYVHVCPMDTLNKMLEKVDNTPKARAKRYEELSQGRHTNKYLTNKFTIYQYNKMKQSNPHAEFDESVGRYKNERLVADFNRSFVLPVKYLKSYLKSGKTYLRLNPPYREALAQKYGLFFMRVGNPVDYISYHDSEFQNRNSA